MSAPDSIYRLVEKFDRDKPGSETELRDWYVDPLFTALGWDLQAKEQVRKEPSIKVWDDGIERSKRADYSFHIGSTTHFYVETKMPHVNLERNPIPAFQLRRYGWSGTTPVSVLTDFEEFCVYDCRIQPQRSDAADEARLLYFQYSDYIDKWDELAARFSREAVASGSLREWVEGERVRGFLSVDQAFLREMESWRDALAKEIALHNRELSQRDLNLLVQRTIDRIVFLRIAEDRDIEAYGRLRSAAAEGKQVYAELKILFNEADDKYNSGLFHFGAETRASQPDTLSLRMHIPDEVLRRIIKKLYFPFSPYEFSVLPADILGQVYEQFLGKVIELSDGGGVRVQEKPEVRKAGGVYYTPAYIVDYIVENTVGKLLEGVTPDDAEKLRILDPACGSGSFLSGAYQYLLDWHLDYYRAHPSKYRNRTRDIAGAGLILTTAEKRRILQNNIYGVDLDQNAVEVSKLSLLLKMLENDSPAAGTQTLMFSAGGRILPDLSGNIKWGNSLIGSDFYSGEQMTFFDNEALLRVKPFDWDSAAGFGEIMAAGGFDAVIGNPPYGAWFDAGQGKYFANNFTVFKGVKDVYVAFIERALKLAKPKGLLSFIVPSAWTGGPRYTRLRDYLLEYTFKNVVLLPYDVFADAYVDTLVFVLEKEGLNQEHRVFTYVYGKRDKVTSISLEEHEWDQIEQAKWQNIENRRFVLDSATIGILSTIKDTCINQFKDIIDIKRGVLFSKYLLTRAKTSDLSYPYFEGDVYRYRMNHKAENWIEFNDKMRERPKEFIWFEGERILLRRLVNRQQRLMAILVKDTFITNKNLYSVIANSSISLQLILALLNSRLFSYLYLKQVTQATKDDFPQVTIRDIKSLPIPPIPTLEAHNGKMVALVDTMLDLHRQLPKLSGERRRIVESLIAKTDAAIDKLVYELYSLTDDEVRVVEGG